MRLEGGIIGRIDDMIWFRGANIYPSAIEQTVRNLPQFGSEYQIVISGDRTLPNLTVRVEPAADRDAAQAAVDRLGSDLQEAIRVRAVVELVDAGTLQRVDDRTKAKRVVDLRTN